MRNLTVATAAITGAWLMVHASPGWATTASSAAIIQNPLGIVALLPSIFVGALLGAIVGSLFCPFRS